MVLEQERNLINTVNIRINLAHPLQKFFGGKSPEASSLASMALTCRRGCGLGEGNRPILERKNPHMSFWAPDLPYLMLLLGFRYQQHRSGYFSPVGVFLEKLRVVSKKMIQRTHPDGR